jgi:hypothetical protein
MADDARHPTGENPERLGRLDTSDESTPRSRRGHGRR